MPDDVITHNRRAWDRQVEQGNRWTVPVTPPQIEAARRGEWSVVLTPHIPVPRDWFPPLEGLRVLCLASAGGQLAAGFTLLGFYEDRHHRDEHPLAPYISTFIATLALKRVSER